MDDVAFIEKFEQAEEALQRVVVMIFRYLEIFV